MKVLCKKCNRKFTPLFDNHIYNGSESIIRGNESIFNGTENIKTLKRFITTNILIVIFITIRVMSLRKNKKHEIIGAPHYEVNLQRLDNFRRFTS